MVITKNIVYGSPEAKEAGEVEVQQHSRIVARQKYLHVFECSSRQSAMSITVSDCE